jgi:hypothetical protein
MKAESLKVSFTKKLNGRWDWDASVWFGPSFFAGVVLKSSLDFETETECREDLNKVLKKFGLDQTPIQTPGGYLSQNRLWSNDKKLRAIETGLKSARKAQMCSVKKKGKS